jgi:threonine dehydrogenase-like Zn-dependent dehydrogenase
MQQGNYEVWFSGPGSVEIRSSGIPYPKPGEVLIRTHATLISAGTELALLREPAATGSAWSDFARFPRSVGYSNVGEVARLGAGVTESLEGALVASRGSHAAWVVRDATDIRLVPLGVSARDAAFTTLACIAMHGLRRVGLSWGERVCVFGLGVVGQLCVRFAAAAGAATVYGFDRSDFRRSRLPPQCFVRALASDLKSALAQTRADTSGLGLDVVVEATGAAELIAPEVGFLRDQGRLLLLSSPRAAIAFDFHDLCNRRSLTIVGAHGFSQPTASTPDHPWTRQRNGDLFLAWLAEERASVGELVTHRFDFERAGEAYALLLDQPDDMLAVVLEWP